MDLLTGLAIGTLDFEVTLEADLLRPLEDEAAAAAAAIAVLVLSGSTNVS